MRNLSLLLFFPLLACELDPKKDDDSPASLPPVIENFTALPVSVNEGEAVTLKVTGSSIESCRIFVGGEEVTSFTLTESGSHIPSSIETQYDATCYGAGQEVTASASVNIIVADDVITTDLISEISKGFDIEEVKALVAEQFPEQTVVDYSPDYRPNTFETFKNEAISVAQKSAGFDQENSVMYGFEGNFDINSYNQQCEQSLVIDSDTIGYADLSIELETSSTPGVKLAEDLIHISNFEAITQSLENPVPQGTEWQVTFDLSQTRVAYEAAFQDFDTAEGSFVAFDNTEPQQDASIHHIPYDESFSGDMIRLWTKIKTSIENLSVAFAASFPPRYPVPPPKDGYQYDPKHPTVNSATAAFNYTTAEFGENMYKLACDEQENRAACLCNGKWQRHKQTGASGLREFRRLFQNDPACNDPHRVVFLRPFSAYVSKVGSRRVVTGAGNIQCNTRYGALARSYGLTSTWAITYPNAQWFVYDANWPGCGGYRCPGKGMRNGPADNRWSNIEPYTNNYISRWMNLDYNQYDAGIIAACKASPVFVQAVDDANERNKSEKMANQCNQDNSCQKLGEAIVEVLSQNVLTSSLKAHVDEVSSKLRDARSANISYVIPNDDPFFSKISSIESAYIRLNAGYNNLVAQHNATGANWNQGMKILTGKDMPRGFQSAGELRSTIDEYKTQIQRMKDLSTNEIRKMTCSFSARGRFRKYSDINTLKVSNVVIDGSTIDAKLTNVAPITLN